MLTMHCSYTSSDSYKTESRYIRASTIAVTSLVYAWLPLASVDEILSLHERHRAHLFPITPTQVEFDAGTLPLCCRKIVSETAWVVLVKTRLSILDDTGLCMPPLGRRSAHVILTPDGYLYLRETSSTLLLYDTYIAFVVIIR